MKQWIKSVLYIPKHQKPTDENILRLLLPSLMGIVICMICLAGSTWAWFTANVQTKPQAIAAANYEIEVTIDGEPVAAPISLQAGQIYKITLTAGGTAAEFGGYCKVEGDGKTRYTEQMLPGETLTFTLIPDSDGMYTFTAVWGKYSGEANISSGDTVGQEPAEEETPPSPVRLDEELPVRSRAGRKQSLLLQQRAPCLRRRTNLHQQRHPTAQLGTALQRDKR